MDPMNLAAPVSLAAEHPLIDIDLTVLVQFVLFLVLFVAGTALLWKPFLRLRDKRMAATAGARDEAVRMTAEADAKLADYEQKLAAARGAAAEETRKVRAEAAAYERDVTDKARAAAMQATTEATEKVRGETQAARAQLLPQAEVLARSMASKLLGREVA